MSRNQPLPLRESLPENGQTSQFPIHNQAGSTDMKRVKEFR